MDPFQINICDRDENFFVIILTGAHLAVLFPRSQPPWSLTCFLEALLMEFNFARLALECWEVFKTKIANVLVIRIFYGYASRGSNTDTNCVVDQNRVH